MDVDSPENGFDEISDLLKDDESTLPEDLDLSFLLNKDIAPDYVYDDFDSDNKFGFDFSEQGKSELPALMSNSRCYETPEHPFENFPSSANTGCSSDGLPDTGADVPYNEELLEFRSPVNCQNEDAEKLCDGYLRESASQVDLASIDDGPVTNLEEEKVDMRDSLPNLEMDAETFSERLAQELSQSEFPYKEEDDDVPVRRIEKLQLSPTSDRGDAESDYGNSSNLRNTTRDWRKELDSFPVDQQGTCFCPNEVPHYQLISASDGLQDASFLNMSHEQECCEPNSSVDPTPDHSLHTSAEDSVSSPVSWQKSQLTQGEPEKHVDTPEIKSPSMKRSMSQSPIRQTDDSSGHKRICHSEAEAEAGSRGWHKRSSETADCSHQSPGSSTRHVFGEVHSRSPEHKHHDLLFRTTGVEREVTSQERTAHTGLQDSISTSPRESSRRFKNNCSSRCSPDSPKTHTSPRGGHRRRVERSDSPSPVRRRDLHAGSKRERDKPRSRSPHARDRRRMRYFSRRKSPAGSCSSHHRSPESRYSSPASTRTGRGRPGKCLFVAGFAFSTTERELERKFSRFSHVRSVRVIRDRRSGISRGYGFVTLRRDEEADAAIRALHKTEWNGRMILVEKSFRC